MPALYHIQAVAAVTGKEITVRAAWRWFRRRRVVLTLRNEAEWSADDYFRWEAGTRTITALEHELAIGTRIPAADRHIREALYRRQAALYVRQPDALDALPFTAIRDVLALGEGYRSETMLPPDGEPDAAAQQGRWDVGLLMGRMQRYFGGAPADWYLLPRYLLEGYTRTAKVDAQERERANAAAGRPTTGRQTRSVPLTKMLGVGRQPVRRR